MGMYHESIMKIWNCKKKWNQLLLQKNALRQFMWISVRLQTQLRSTRQLPRPKKNQTYNPKRWFRPTTVQAFAGNFTAWALQEKFGAKGRANESSVFYEPGHMIGFWYAEYKMPRDLAKFEPVTSLVIRPQDVLTTQFIQEGMYKLSR